MHVNVCDLFTGLFLFVSCCCCFSLKLYDTYFTYVIIHRNLECDIYVYYIHYNLYIYMVTPNPIFAIFYFLFDYFTAMILFAIYCSPKTCDNIEVLKDLLESFGMQHT